MERNVDRIVENLRESELDKPTATLLVSSKSDSLHFIGEALLIATGIALLHAYLTGLLGADKLGENHQHKIKEFWKKIRSGKLSPEDTDEARKLAEHTLNEIDESAIAREAIRKAEREIEQILLNEGSTRTNASRLATAITRSLFPSDDDGKHS